MSPRLARALPDGRDDVLAGEHAGVNVKNNDPSLIEAIAINEPAQMARHGVRHLGARRLRSGGSGAGLGAGPSLSAGEYALQGGDGGGGSGM
jgi:hypothetical protein